MFDPTRLARVQYSRSGVRPSMRLIRLLLVEKLETFDLPDVIDRLTTGPLATLPNCTGEPLPW